MAPRDLMIRRVCFNKILPGFSFLLFLFLASRLGAVTIPYVVFHDTPSDYVASGGAGDLGDVSLALDTTGPAGGTAAIRVQYAAAPGSGQGWFALYCLAPAGNMGNVPTGGLNLTGAKSLRFWARGQTGHESIYFGMGSVTGAYGDTSFAVIGPITLTTSWKEYAIDLIGKDLSRVVDGFAIAATRADNPEGAVFWMDGIRYDVAPVLPAPSAWPYFIFKESWIDYVPSYGAGDVSDLQVGMENVGTTSTNLAFRVDYSASAGEGQQFAAGYFLNPSGNLATVSDGGLDLRTAKKIKFLARGKVGGEKMHVGAGGMQGVFGDHFFAVQGPITLTDAWMEYALDLRGQDLSRVVDGFAFALAKSDNPSGATFYLDDIRYEQDVELGRLNLPLAIYRDMHDEYYPSGWMGDGEVPGRVIFSDTETSNPGEGTQCIKVGWTAPAFGQGWFGVYWQSPGNNWGTDPNGGYRLTGAKKIQFMARGQNGGEKINVGAGGITGAYRDSFTLPLKEITLTPSWQSYELDLSGMDLSRVVGGFVFTATRVANPAGITFYLDRILYDDGSGNPPAPSVAILPLPQSIFKDFDGRYLPSFSGDAPLVPSASAPVVFDEMYSLNPGEGVRCLRIVYKPLHANATNGWFGVQWISPTTNKGADPNAGNVLTGAKKLRFMARGQAGGEKVTFSAGGTAGPYGDTFQVVDLPVTLTTAWQTFEMSLDGKDLSRVLTAFSIKANHVDNPAAITFFVDDIVFDDGSVIAPPPPPNVRPLPLPYALYSEPLDYAPDFYIPSGGMGDATVPGRVFINPMSYAAHNGFFSESISYAPPASGGQGWFGVYWLTPLNNWGTDPLGGFNLTGARKITFWARGQNGGEKLKVSAGGVLGVTSPYGDTFQLPLKDIILTNTWQSYELDLTGQDLSRVVGGFLVEATQEDNPSGCTFYLDDIIYTSAP